MWCKITCRTGEGLICKSGRTVLPLNHQSWSNEPTLGHSRSKVKDLLRQERESEAMKRESKNGTHVDQ